MSLTDEELAELYGRYAHVVYHRCYAILGNEEDANDAVQETFARVFRKAETFRRQSSPLTWMYRISTNYCLNQIRNRKGRRDKLHVHRQDIVGSGLHQPSEGALTDHARILSLLDDADDQTRACVIHTYFDDCTREETAQLVGISVPTVRKRLNAFLDRARRAFGVHAVALTALALSLLSWSQP